MEASSHSSSWRDKLGAAMGFVSIFHAHTRWRYMRWQVTLTNHPRSFQPVNHPPRVLPLLPAQRALKNWVWDANSREHTRFHTTKKFNDLITPHLFQSKKHERSERLLIENDRRNKFYLIKVSKTGSEMSLSGRSQNYQKAKVHNFFFVFFIRKKIGTCAF